MGDYLDMASPYDFLDKKTIPRMPELVEFYK